MPFNSSATPKPGAAPIDPAVFSKIDIEALGDKIKATIEKARADDPAFLRAQLQNARAELVDARIMASHNAAMVKESEPVRIPVLDEDQFNKIRAAYESAEAIAIGLDEDLGEFQSKMEAAFMEMSRLMDLPASLLQGIQKTLTESNARVAYGPANPIGIQIRRAEIIPPSNLSPKTQARIKAGLDRYGAAEDPKSAAQLGIGEGEKKILILCAQYPAGVTKKQLIILSGYARATRDKYLQTLGRAGLVGIRGQSVQITEAGLALLGGEWEPLPMGDELRAYWLHELPEGEALVLHIICAAWPNAIKKDLILEASGYARATRDKYLQRLAARHLIEDLKNQEVKASGELFS